MPTLIDDATPTPAHRASIDAALRPSIRITGNTTLSYPTVVGVPYEVESASAVLVTLPNGSGIRSGTIINGHNIGAGLLSFAASGDESIVGNAELPSTVAQYDPFELRRINGNRWLRIA